MLPNRRFFTRVARRTRSRRRAATSRHDRRCCYIDLDGFTAVNDRTAHDAATRCSSRSPTASRATKRDGDVLRAHRRRRVRARGAERARRPRARGCSAQRLLDALERSRAAAARRRRRSARRSASRSFPTTRTIRPGLIAAADVGDVRGASAPAGTASRSTRRRRSDRLAPSQSPRATRRRSDRACGDVGARTDRTASPAVARSHVSWRLASWRVAAMPRARSAWQVDRAVEVAPRLPVADAAHRRHLRRQRDGGRAARRARRRGPRRASRRSAARSPRAAARGPAAQRDASVAAEPAVALAPRPAAPTAARRSARDTSSARWMRCASVGASRAAVVGIDARELGMQRRPAVARGARIERGAHARIGLRQRGQAFASAP